MQSVGLALTIADLRLAIAHQVTQVADRLGRHQARPQQSGLGEPTQPGGVRNVGLAARARSDRDQNGWRPSPTTDWPPSRTETPTCTTTRSLSSAASTRT